MSEKEMFSKSFNRPSNYFKLIERKQWEIDSNLEILDWKGDNLSTKDIKKFENHYK